MSADGTPRAAGEWRCTSLGWLHVEATTCSALDHADAAWERDADARWREARERGTALPTRETPAVEASATPTLPGVGGVR